MSEILLVQNPLSRRGNHLSTVLDRYLDSKGLQSRVERVSITELESASQPDDRVVAVGGDGTVNSVVTWVWRKDIARTIGIVPAGTGNHLAHGLGVPKDLDEALDIAFFGKNQVAVDAGVYGAISERGAALEKSKARLLIQGGGLGFPATVAADYERRRKNGFFRRIVAPIGTHVYTLLALLELRRQKSRDRRGGPFLEIECSIDGETIEGPMLGIFMGNDASIGGNFLVCPKAKMDDGKLDYCLLRAQMKTPYSKLMMRAKKGDHLDMDGVLYRQSGAAAEFSCSEKVPFLADGDLWIEGDRFRLEVARAGFSVFVGEKDE